LVCAPAFGNADENQPEATRGFTSCNGFLKVAPKVAFDAFSKRHRKNLDVAGKNAADFLKFGMSSRIQRGCNGGTTSRRSFVANSITLNKSWFLWSAFRPNQTEHNQSL
jgi:hypothetical protein